jgi:integrase/recombinase XerD
MTLDCQTIDKISTNKIKSATDGMQQECYDRLVAMKLGIAEGNRENSDIIADYLIAYKNESDTKVSTRTTICLNMIRFTQKVAKEKPLGTIDKNDILLFFDGLKKSEDVDPKHKWKGTWNLLRIIVPRFFKWFYYPNLPPSKRPKPDMIPYIPRMKRKEKTYKPSDMWTIEENELFLKYCPDPRIRCYHSIAAATGARPHEILNLKKEDIIWPLDGGNPYFTVYGKTGQRSLKIFRFQSYIKEWMEHHPSRGVSSSYLIWSKKTKDKLNVRPLAGIYSHLKVHFSKLLQEPIGQDDRNSILHLLKKPWNPYVLRQTVATEYLGSGALTKSQGDQWFGWSERSNTAVVYQNYLGDEAANSLGAYFGVPEAKQTNKPKLPKQRQCPNINCQVLNTPEAPFCTKCRIPLTVPGHMEREQEFKDLKEQVNQMGQELKSWEGIAEKMKVYVDMQKKEKESLETRLRRYIDEHSWYVNRFGLSEPYRKKIEEFREKLKDLPDSDNVG